MIITIVFLSFLSGALMYRIYYFFEITQLKKLLEETEEYQEKLMDLMKKKGISLDDL